MTEHSYFVDTPWTWRERLQFRLFPARYCQLPKAPAAFADVLVCKTVCRLSMIDRLRVLVSGYLTVETRTVTENTIGGHVTSSVAYPCLKPAIAKAEVK